MNCVLYCVPLKHSRCIKKWFEWIVENRNCVRVFVCSFYLLSIAVSCDILPNCCHYNKLNFQSFHKEWQLQHQEYGNTKFAWMKFVRLFKCVDYTCEKFVIKFWCAWFNTLVGCYNTVCAFCCCCCCFVFSCLMFGYIFLATN